MNIDDLFIIDSDKYIVIGKKELINSVAALKKQFEGSGITNKLLIKSHILLDKQRLEDTGLSMYKMDECIDECSVEKAWDTKTNENYEIAEMQLVYENDKNYIVGKNTEDDWFGVEVNPKTVETLKKMKSDKVLKFFYNELSR